MAEGNLRLVSTRPKRFVASIVLAGITLAPQGAAADAFCDHLMTIANGAPDFTELRGAPMERGGYWGTAIIAQSPPCTITNQNDHGTPIPTKWQYTCAWANRYPESVSWMRTNIQKCLPDAKFTDASEAGISDEKGGVFSYSNIAIAFLFNPKTGRLTLQIENPYR